MASRSTSTFLPPSFFVFGPERSGMTLWTFLLAGQPSMFCINDSFLFKCFVDSVMWSSRDRATLPAKTSSGYCLNCCQK